MISCRARKKESVAAVAAAKMWRQKKQYRWFGGDVDDPCSIAATLVAGRIGIVDDRVETARNPIGNRAIVYCDAYHHRSGRDGCRTVMNAFSMCEGVGRNRRDRCGADDDGCGKQNNSSTRHDLFLSHLDHFRRLPAAHEFPVRQLFFAPSRIQARMASRSQVDSFFLPSGMWVSGAPRQSSSHIRLLPSASPGITILPDLVPFMTPS
jgi:hypothetical protein